VSRSHRDANTSRPDAPAGKAKPHRNSSASAKSATALICPRKWRLPTLCEFPPRSDADHRRIACRKLPRNRHEDRDRSNARGSSPHIIGHRPRLTPADEYGDSRTCRVQDKRQRHSMLSAQLHGRRWKNARRDAATRLPFLPSQWKMHVGHIGVNHHRARRKMIRSPTDRPSENPFTRRISISSSVNIRHKYDDLLACFIALAEMLRRAESPRRTAAPVQQWLARPRICRAARHTSHPWPATR